MIASCTAPAPQPFSQLQAAAIACSTAASSAQRRHLQVVQTMAFPSRQAPSVISRVIHAACCTPMRKVTPSMLGSIALLFHWAPQISQYPREPLPREEQKDPSVSLELISVLYTQEYFDFIHSRLHEMGLDSHLTGRCFH